MKQDNRIRIVLNIDLDSSPELFAEIEKISARARAERIRTLATVGIACSGQELAARPRKMFQKKSEADVWQNDEEKENPANKALMMARNLSKNF